MSGDRKSLNKYIGAHGAPWTTALTGNPLAEHAATVMRKTAVLFEIATNKLPPEDPGRINARNSIIDVRSEAVKLVGWKSESLYILRGLVESYGSMTYTKNMDVYPADVSGMPEYDFAFNMLRNEEWASKEDVVKTIKKGLAAMIKGCRILNFSQPMICEDAKLMLHEHSQVPQKVPQKDPDQLPDKDVAARRAAAADSEAVKSSESVL